MRWCGVVLVLVAALVACDRSVDSVWSGQEYVALGDSYTAAPGTGANHGEHCYQSAQNYPRLVAEELGLDLHDVACGGANTQHLTESFPRYGAPPQLDALSEDTDLVTISIGGNDASVYAHSMFTCVHAAPRDPTGTPCVDQIGEDYFDTAAAALREKLGAALSEIAERSPDARIVVVGYPEWAPPDAPEDCDQLPLADGDYAFVRRANELMVQAQEGAAKDAGVDYVDLWSVSQGHHMCAEDPWIAGYQPTDGTADIHPYPEEQEVVADLIVDLLED